MMMPPVCILKTLPSGSDLNERCHALRTFDTRSHPIVRLTPSGKACSARHLSRSILAHQLLKALIAFQRRVNIEYFVGADCIAEVSDKLDCGPVAATAPAIAIGAALRSDPLDVKFIIELATFTLFSGHV